MSTQKFPFERATSDTQILMPSRKQALPATAESHQAAWARSKKFSDDWLLGLDMHGVPWGRERNWPAVRQGFTQERGATCRSGNVPVKADGLWNSRSRTSSRARSSLQLCFQCFRQTSDRKGSAVRGLDPSLLLSLKVTWICSTSSAFHKTPCAPARDSPFLESCEQGFFLKSLHITDDDRMVQKPVCDQLQPTTKLSESWFQAGGTMQISGSG